MLVRAKLPKAKLKIWLLVLIACVKEAYVVHVSMSSLLEGYYPNISPFKRLISNVGSYTWAAPIRRARLIDSERY